MAAAVGRTAVILATQTLGMRTVGASGLSLATRIRLGCSATAAAIGAIVLYGWADDLVALTQLAPGLSAMNPVTAACLMALGLGLAAHDRLPAPVLWSIGMLVCAFGVSKLLQLNLDGAPHIDQLLFASKLGHGAGVPPNQMAPNSAAALIAASVALATSRVRSHRVRLASQVLSLLVFAITLFALIGYALRVVALYKVHLFNPMALHTAVALMVLSLGLLSATPETVLMRMLGDRGPAGQMARVALPLAVVFPVVIGMLRLMGEALGYYGTESGIALQVFADVVFTAALLLASIFVLHQSDLQRRQQERAVLGSEQEYRLAERMGNVGHWRLDLASGEVTISEQFLTICGLAPGSRPKVDELMALYTKESAALQVECSRRAKTEGVGWDAKRQIVRADGEGRHIRSLGISEANDRGEIVSMFGVFVDEPNWRSPAVAPKRQGRRRPISWRT